MNTPGVRPLMQPPALPRIASRPASDERDGVESDRSLQRRQAAPADRRPRAWSADPPATSRASTPVRDARSAGSRPAAAPASEKAPLPASRAAVPAAGTARLVDAATIARLRPGTVVRLAAGGFEIELVLRDSRLHGKVLAKSGAAKDLIEGHLDDLRRGLERRGIEIAAFEVLVAEPDPAPSGEPVLRSGRRPVLDLLA